MPKMDETMTAPGALPASGAERYASILPSSASISTWLRITVSCPSLSRSARSRFVGVGRPLEVDLQNVVVDAVAIDEVHALQADLDALRRPHEMVCVRARERGQNIAPELRHMETRVDDELSVARRLPDAHVADDMTASRDRLLPGGAEIQQSLATRHNAWHVVVHERQLRFWVDIAGPRRNPVGRIGGEQVDPTGVVAAVEILRLLEQEVLSFAA